MVHALCEIWRVLAGSGTLVDLRPLPGQCPVEAVTSDSVVQIGEVDATGMIADDAAADRAIRDVVEHGSFVPRRDIRFDFDIYWNSVPDLASFIEGSKRMKQVVPSYADLDEVHRELSERSRAKVRLRCRRRTLLAVYAKAC